MLPCTSRKEHHGDKLHETDRLGVLTAILSAHERRGPGSGHLGPFGVQTRFDEHMPCCRSPRPGLGPFCFDETNASLRLKMTDNQ